MKFGGDCLSTPKNQLIVFNIIKKFNCKCVVITSAMGRMGFPYSTDSLLLLTNNNISLKEQDRLLACGEIISSIRMSEVLNENHIKAYSLSFSELGINCNDDYSHGKVVFLNNEKILSKLKENDVLLCPGFIGKSLDNEIITLGRGNSDFSCVLIGKMLKQKLVYLYKNVDGVYHTHPSVYKQFMLYDYISYEEMLLLNQIDFNIVSLSCIEFAKKNHITIEIRNYLTNKLGTLISSKRKNDLIIGFNIIDKTVKIASFNCLKVQEILKDELLKNHLFIKNEIIDNNKYCFECSKSIILMVKKIILTIMEKNQLYN